MPATRLFFLPTHLTFTDWKNQVEEQILRIAGVRSDEIPDWDYAAAWDAGSPPTEAATRALLAAEFPMTPAPTGSRNLAEGEEVVAWLRGSIRIEGVVTKYIGQHNSYEIRTHRGLRVVHADHVKLLAEEDV